MKYALALTASAALALSSCTSVRVETDDVPQSEGSPIRLAVLCDGEPGTKAMLDESSFKKEGNALQIWDAYYNDVQTTPTAYLDGKYVVCDGSNAVWPFRPSVDDTSVQDHYYWTKTGVHRFYGVLVNDKSSGTAMTPETLFGNGCGFGKSEDAPYKYVVPKTEMNLTSSQFDFLYSNVFERDLDKTGSTAAVELQFSHLFSAFAFTLTNDSPSEFKIKSMSLNVDNVASASIDYTSAWRRDETPAPAATYTYGTRTAISGDAVDMKAGECRDLFKATVISDASTLENYTGHTLMWPQSLTGKTMTLSYETTVKQPVTRNIYKYSYRNNGSYYVTFTDDLTKVSNSDYKSLDYSYNSYFGRYEYIGRGEGEYAVLEVSTSYVSNSQRCSRTQFGVTDYELVTKTNQMKVDLYDATPEHKWDAGKRYLYRLVRSGNEISLKVTVMQWNSDHGGEVDFN